MLKSIFKTIIIKKYLNVLHVALKGKTNILTFKGIFSNFPKRSDITYCFKECFVKPILHFVKPFKRVY